MNKMPCHITDGPQYGDELPEIDEDTYLSGSDEAFAKERQANAAALKQVIKDIARSLDALELMTKTQAE